MEDISDMNKDIDSRSIVLHYVDEMTVENEISKVYFLINNEMVEDADINLVGFTGTTPMLLSSSGIKTCSQLVNMKYTQFRQLKSMGEKRAQTIIDKLKSITFILYTDETMNSSLREKLIIDKVVKQIGEVPITYYELRGALEDIAGGVEEIDRILEELKRNRVIEETQRGYVRYLPWATDCITHLKSQRGAEALSFRLQGMTLELAGKMLDVTRERARQLEVKALGELPEVRESRYSYWFNNYELEKKDFTYIFDLSDSSYNYIKLYLSEKNDNKKSIIDLFDDELLTNNSLVRLESIARQYCVMMGGKYIPISRDHILKRLLEMRYSDKDCTVPKLLDEYSDFINDRGLVRNHPQLVFNELHVLEAWLDRKNYIIAGQNKKVRFYDHNEYDFSNLFKQLDLSRFANKLISTKILFDAHPEVMDEYNIKNENELHNLFRRYENLATRDDIVVNRMPNITIGEVDIEKQVVQLLYKAAPISKNDFAVLYSEAYGVEPMTFLSNYPEFFAKYDNHGVLDIAQESMNDVELKYMSESLSSDFYFMEDVEEKYTDIFPGGNVQRVNPLNLRKLGFNVYSNYIVRNTYGTADEYFNALVMNEAGFDMDELDSRMVYVQSFYATLEKRRVAFDIVEIEKGRYIPFEKLAEKYAFIKKSDLEEYADKLPEYVKNEVFTVKYARNIGFTSVLDDLDESDWFLSALLRANKSINYRKVGDGIIFSHNRDSVDSTYFLRQIVERHQPLTIEEIIKYAEDIYGIKLVRHKVVGLIDRCGMIYDRETGIVATSDNLE